MAWGWGIRRVMAILPVLLLSAGAAKIAPAQSMTLRLPAELTNLMTKEKSSRYQIEVLPGYGSVPVGKNGLLTTRVRVKYYFLTLPECYANPALEKLDFSNQTGLNILREPIRGVDLAKRSNRATPPYGELGPEEFKKHGLLHSGTVSKPPSQASPKPEPKPEPGRNSEQVELHNAIRMAIPRNRTDYPEVALNGLNDIRDAGLGKNRNTTETIEREDLIFAFGDVLNNSRAARELAYMGIHSLDLSDFDFQRTRQGKNQLRIFADPRDPRQDQLEEVTPNNVKNYSLWHFNLYDVGTVDGYQMPAMAEVWVEWVFEAQFDPRNMPDESFPLVRLSYTPPPSRRAGEATGGAGQQAGGSVQTPPIVKNFDPAILGLADLGGLNLANIQSSGIPVLAGYAVKDDGPAPLYALQIKEPDREPTSRSGNLFEEARQFLNRSGYFIGRTSGGRQATVLGLTRPLGSIGHFYVGGGFRDASGLTRFRPVAGLAFNANRFLSGQRDEDSERVDILVENAEVYRPACLKDSHAAVVWQIQGMPKLQRPADKDEQETMEKQMPEATFQLRQPYATNSDTTTERLLFYVSPRYITFVLPSNSVKVDRGTYQVMEKPLIPTDWIYMIRREGQENASCGTDDDYSFDAGQSYVAVFKPPTGDCDQDSAPVIAANPAVANSTAISSAAVNSTRVSSATVNTAVGGGNGENEATSGAAESAPDRAAVLSSHSLEVHCYTIGANRIPRFLPGMTVQLFRHGTNNLISDGRSDANGSARFNPGPGRYRIEIVSRSYPRVTEAVTIPASGKTEVGINVASPQ